MLFEKIKHQINVKFEDIKDIYAKEIAEMMYKLSSGTSIQKGSSPEDLNWKITWTEEIYLGPKTWQNKKNWWYKTNDLMKEKIKDGSLPGKNTPEDVNGIFLYASKGKWSYSIRITSVIIPIQIHTFYEKK